MLNQTNWTSWPHWCNKLSLKLPKTRGKKIALLRTALQNQLELRVLSTSRILRYSKKRWDFSHISTSFSKAILLQPSFWFSLLSGFYLISLILFFLMSSFFAPSFLSSSEFLWSVVDSFDLGKKMNNLGMFMMNWIL